MKTPYDVLGVRRYADDATIRAALRKAAKAYHPDVNADNPAAVQHLREVIAAYEMLRNPQQRAAYDQLLRRRRREKARRLATTAVASAGVVSASTLALTVWLSQPQPASERLPEQAVAAVLAKEHAATAGHAGSRRVEPDDAGSEATAKPRPPPVAVAGMVIRPANGAHTEGESGPHQNLDKTQVDDGPDVTAGQPPPEPASAEENVGSAATDLGAGPPPVPEDDKSAPEPAATPQAFLAEEWKGMRESRDLLAVWAFAAHNPQAPEASLARSRLTELIDAAEDAASLSALHVAATGAIAEAAQRRLARLNAAIAPQQVTVDAASDGASGDAAPSSDPAFYLARGLRWSQKGALDRAIADFDRAIELAPGNALAHSHRASAWGAKGEKDRALADFETAMRLDPGNPVPFRDRGILWRRSGALDLALIDLDRAIRLGFSDAGAYNERGLVWHAKSRNERAIADFDRAIKIDPTFAAAYTNRGIALRGRGDLDRAIADFDAAIRIDPGIAAAYYHRAHARSERQDFEQASADYARARELMPNAHIR